MIDSPLGKLKISPEFAARLNSYAPTEKVRVMVLLESIKPQQALKSHHRLERKAAIKAMQDSVKQSFQTVDSLIQDFNGQKLAPQPNAFGAIPVEITPLGIQALALSDAVKAIIEDQKIHHVCDKSI